MNEGVKKFIMLVGAHFPRQKFVGEEEREALWLRSMGEILGGYADDVLMEAAANIVKTRDPKEDGSMFPKPVECIRACETVLRKRASFALMTAPKIEVEKALASIEIRIGDSEWLSWMEHLRQIKRHDLVGEAESKGKICVSTRWPRDGSILLDPNPDNNSGFLSGMLAYKNMPN
jgi:hypothetical protein